MVKKYLESIDRIELHGPLMWVTNVTTEQLEDITPAAAAAIGKTVEEAIDEAPVLPVSGYWLTPEPGENWLESKEVVATGEPRTATWWVRDPKHRIHRYIVTKTKIDEERVLVVASDATHTDLRLEWLERVHFRDRCVWINNNVPILSFTNMEALELMVRGYSNKTGADKLNISVAAFKKRLDRCMQSFGAETREELRIAASETGFIHLLMIPHMPPYDKDLTLTDVLKTISM